MQAFPDVIVHTLDLSTRIYYEKFARNLSIHDKSSSRILSISVVHSQIGIGRSTFLCLRRLAALSARDNSPIARFSFATASPFNALSPSRSRIALPSAPATFGP